MDVSVARWAEAGLPLARTFIAMGRHARPLAPGQLAQLTNQPEKEVRLQLDDFFCRYHFASRDKEGLFSLTPAGLAHLNGDARPLPAVVRRVRRTPLQREAPIGNDRPSDSI